MKTMKSRDIKELEKIYKELYAMFSSKEVNLTWSIQGLCEGITKAYTEYKLKKLDETNCSKIYKRTRRKMQAIR